MKTTIKRNLLLGLGLSLILLIISSSASYISIKNLIRSSEMVRHSNSIIEKLNAVSSTIKDAETSQRGYLLTGSDSFIELYNHAKNSTTDVFNDLALLLNSDASIQKNLDRLRNDVDLRMGLLDKNLQIKKNGGTLTSENLLAGKKYMDDLRATINFMQKNEQSQLKQRTDDLNRIAGYTPMLIIAAAVLALLITLVFYKKVLTDFNDKTQLQHELQTKNEEIENRIVAVDNVASQISAGNYQIRLDQITKDSLGSLAVSLNTMAASLQESFHLLAAKEWLQSGIARINDSMVGEKTVSEIAAGVMEVLATHTQSQVGALYLIEPDNQLHLEGAYATDPNQYKKIIQIGEGITGQCFQSMKTVLVSDITGHDRIITFASGEIQAKSVVAIPVFKDLRAVGVIELGTVNQYDPLKIEFLEAISNNIGIAINGAQNRKKLQELLEETQAQAEELQTQHSELESMNAELAAQTSKVLASEEELRVQQEELLQSNQELEERTGLLEEKNKLIEERNEDIRKKSKELEESTKYKSEFLTNISHELRTPLNSILLLSKLMAENDELDKEIVEYAEVIQSSGQGLLNLIDEILDLSKIEAGKMTVEITDVPLYGIANEMKALFMPLAKDKKLQLDITVDNDCPPYLQTDKMRLEQILRNLLSNAIKFTASGEVSLLISCDESRQNILFKVKDSGIGIPQDKLHIIFEAFQQADGSTRRKFGGTGLGLSISRQLARLLHGKIDLESTEGKGSEFTLWLPIMAGALPEPLVAEIPSSRPLLPEKMKSNFVVDHIPNPIEDDRESIKDGEKVILIIEDDTAFAKVLLDYTRQKKYKGIVAVRGDAGIEMANHFKPLAILLDIQLPVMDGWQVMEALKSNPETKPIPVHIMSSLEVKRESLLKGAVDFINKPFALEQMRDIFKKLEHALSRHPKKVLIVEENEQHARALDYFLNSNNINTEIANNVEESIDALSKQAISCVILDMGVPDKNDYETLEIIRQRHGLEKLPIIVFTGKSLSIGDEIRIKKYADSIVIKTAHSYQRILDEAGLFLHLVEEKTKNGHKAPAGPLRELRDVLKGKTVLIADDDVRNIFSLTKALEMHQMKVLPATDGNDALRTLVENPGVDIVLMDMMMPEMDGYETIKKIRAMPKHKNLPVLAVTAKAMMGDREKCIAVGASDYISKPVDIDQLISLLRVWLYDKF
jgi:signal transduction histidine kinase/CheY-like chemotaxis protein/CHASE3 domain sensor protein